MPQILEIFAKHEEIVIYNRAYDAPFIALAAVEAGIHHQLEPHLDKMKCAMLEYAEARGIPGRHAGGSKWHKLIDAAAYVGHQWQGIAHRALADTQATRSVWNWLHPTTTPSPELCHIECLKEED